MIEALSRAKINLYLEVFDKRPDGYHEIETVIQSIDWADQLLFSSSPEGEIVVECSHPAVPTDQTNLCYRAAQLLRAAKDCSEGAMIRIEKTIPVGAGLGGGSSNAAATLLALNRLWRLDLNIEELKPLARDLGADVPYFLSGGCALAEGIGERVTPLPCPADYCLVLLKPRFSLSTKWVYEQYDRELATQTRRRRSSFGIVSALNLRSSPDIGRELFNAFECQVSRKFPEIAQCIAQLMERGALGGAMTGTGSTVFGIFGTLEQASEAMRQIGLRDLAEVRMTRPVSPAVEWVERETA